MKEHTKSAFSGHIYLHRCLALIWIIIIIWEKFCSHSWKILTSSANYKWKVHDGSSDKPSIYLNLIFTILQFEILSLMNWISKLNFTGYSRQKNPVQTKKKIQFIKFDISNWIIAKSNADRQEECLDLVRCSTCRVGN